VEIIVKNSDIFRFNVEHNKYYIMRGNVKVQRFQEITVDILRGREHTFHPWLFGDQPQSNGDSFDSIVSE
jgi:hypothetical protein